MTCRRSGRCGLGTRGKGRDPDAGETRFGEPSTRYFGQSPLRAKRPGTQVSSAAPPARTSLPLPSGNSLQFPQPQRGPRAGSERRRGGRRGRVHRGWRRAPRTRPYRASRRGAPGPPSDPARGAGEVPEAPSRRARAEPHGLAGAGAAGRELLIRTSLADSLRPTMHRGGQPLKKRRGSFKMAELDQLPDESKYRLRAALLSAGCLSRGRTGRVRWPGRWADCQPTAVPGLPTQALPPRRRLCYGVCVSVSGVVRAPAPETESPGVQPVLTESVAALHERLL